MIRPDSKQIELTLNIDCESVIFYDKTGTKYKEIKFNKMLDTVFLQEKVRKGFFRKPFYKIKFDKDEFLFDENAYESFKKDYGEVRNKYLASLHKKEIEQKEIEQKDIEQKEIEQKEIEQKDINQKNVNHKDIIEVNKKKAIPKKINTKAKKKNRKVETKVNIPNNALTNTKAKTSGSSKEKTLAENNKPNIEKQNLSKEKNQTLNVAPLKMTEVYSIISKALQNTGLNKYEIKNNIVVTTNLRQELDLQIDLHSLTVEVANNVLLNILNINKLNISEIRLIHGYNKGRILKNYIGNDFTHSRIRNKVVDASNEGITTLKLKASEDSRSKKKKVKIKSPIMNISATKDKKNESRETIKDRSDFILIMIKEKVRSSDIKSKEFNEIYESILNEDESKHCKKLFEYNFELGFFLDSIREFYEYKDTQYLKISYKKKNVDECNRLLETLIEKFSLSKIECVIKVDKNIGKKLLMLYNELNDMYYQISLLDTNEVFLKGGL